MPVVRGTEIAACVRAVERRDEWNAIVREFRACDARHSWEWGELRAWQGWTPLRLAAFAGGECVAAAAVLARRVPGLGVVAYAPRGPLVDPERNDMWDAAAALADVARERTGAFVVRASPAVLVEDAVSWTPLDASRYRCRPRRTSRRCTGCSTATKASPPPWAASTASWQAPSSACASVARPTCSTRSPRRPRARHPWATSCTGSGSAGRAPPAA